MLLRMPSDTRYPARMGGRREHSPIEHSSGGLVPLKLPERRECNSDDFI